MATIRVAPAAKRKRPASSRRLFVTPSAKRARANPMTRPKLARLTRQVVSIGRGPVAKETIVWLRYNAYHENSSSSLDQIYRLNSIFDPDLTGTGHQPLGRDQYATFYNRYRVTDVIITLRASVDISLGNQVYKVITVADNSITPYTDHLTMSEQQGSTVHLLNPASGAIFIKRRYHLANIAGVDKKGYSDDRFQSLFSTNPSENIMFHVGTCNNNGSGPANATIKYTITLDMRTELFDPLPIAQS